MVVGSLIKSVTDAVTRHGDAVTIVLGAGPHALPGVGIVGHVDFFDTATLSGPGADLLLLAEADYELSAAPIALLAARVHQLGVDDLDHPLDELLGLPELVGDLDNRIHQQWPAVIERFRPVGLPSQLKALVALLASCSSWEHAALADLCFRPSGWLQHGSHVPPAGRRIELFELRMDGAAYSFELDPPGLFITHGGQTSRLELSPCELLAQAAERQDREDPRSGVLNTLERLSLAEAARHFDGNLG